ncbi:hypothetical protein EVAR_2577_1 [Eumeta japonica]|uniref:Uncharacterized protein n=1 Tax=Eumeta variegata TaxID=151549 RepID=A0A4C1SPJ2_EUMVA|nr:hypothetical protein EVAR_2577_1 [Eumeta japonica]
MEHHTRHIYNRLEKFKRGRVNASDEFCNGRPSKQTGMWPYHEIWTFLGKTEEIALRLLELSKSDRRHTYGAIFRANEYASQENPGGYCHPWIIATRCVAGLLDRNRISDGERYGGDGWGVVRKNRGMRWRNEATMGKWGDRMELGHQNSHSLDERQQRNLSLHVYIL